MSATLEQHELDASAIPEFPVKRWTLEEYHQLVNAGVFDDQRVELIEGWITPKMTRNTLHDGTLTLVYEVLSRVADRPLLIRNQQAFTTANSELEPDFAVITGTAREYLKRHPGGSDALLLIEVADSSLTKDRRKAVIYAAAGVPEYWIINLQQNCVEVYQRLNPNTQQYLIQQTLTSNQTVSLKLGEQTHTISVADLLPPADLETAS